MSILVCVPFLKPHKKFLPHFIQWYAMNWEKHGLNLHWEMYRPLHKAQQNAVKVAKEIGASHILFTEDDQWGFPVDGLEVLLEADKDVVGFGTYTKEHPYFPMTYRKYDPSVPLVTRARNLHPRQVVDELETFDLVTWAFTLVRTSVFDRLPGDPFACWDDVPTDSHFCQLCDEAGIERFISNKFVICHGDVHKDDIVFHRRMNDSLFASRGIYGKDAIIVQGEHDDIGYVPEYQRAIQVPQEEAV